MVKCKPLNAYISDAVWLLEHMVLSKFPGQATYPHRIYGGCHIYAMISMYAYGDNTYLELPKNVSETQLCL